jgi:hypothetical protein
MEKTQRPLMPMFVNCVMLITESDARKNMNKLPVLKKTCNQNIRRHQVFVGRDFKKLLNQFKKPFEIKLWNQTLKSFLHTFPQVSSPHFLRHQQCAGIPFVTSHVFHKYYVHFTFHRCQSRSAIYKQC